jgi:hypothetical protein
MELDKLLDVKTEGDDEIITAIYKWIGPSEKTFGKPIEITYHYTGTYDIKTKKVKKAVH